MTAPVGQAGRPVCVQLRHATPSHRRSRAFARGAACSAAPTWRLADAGGVGPQFLRLAAGIEAQWRSHPGMASLAPLPVDPRFVTADGGVEAERLRLENRFYTTPVFRKCHLELAAGAGGLSVVHCVMFPWAQHDLPLFAVDIVGFGPRVTLAIADVCPSREDLSLPPGYERVGALAAEHLGGVQLRGIPDWGRRIFSQHCMCLTPQAEADVDAFCAYTLALLGVHLDAAAAVAMRPRSAAEVAATAVAHARFCACQLENDKTRRILARAFGAPFADEYMDSVLFDFDEVPLAPPPR